MTDRQLLVSFVTMSVGISAGTVHLILLENLLTNNVSARSVPQMLSDVQLPDRVNALTRLLCLFNENSDNFVSRFVTADET